MHEKRPSRLPLALAFGSPVLAAAVTAAMFLVIHLLPRISVGGLPAYVEHVILWFDGFVAFAGPAAGGLMTRGGPFRRSAVAFGTGTCGVALYFALLMGVFMATWSD